MLGQVLCVVEHFLCLENEDLASYVKRIRLVRCQQANEGGQKTMENHLSFGYDIWQPIGDQCIVYELKTSCS